LSDALAAGAAASAVARCSAGHHTSAIMPAKQTTTLS
jgi:hypothetical protein